MVGDRQNEILSSGVPSIGTFRAKANTLDLLCSGKVALQNKRKQSWHEGAVVRRETNYDEDTKHHTLNNQECADETGGGER